MAKNKKTGADKALSVIGVCLLCGLGLSVAATGAVHLDRREETYKTEAVAFVEQASKEEGILFLDESNNDYETSKYKKEQRISKGKYIYEEITNRDILYCNILDEYYTANGDPIVFIDTLDEEGNVISTRVEFLKDGSFIMANNEYGRIFNTKPYKDIIDMDLVLKIDTKTKNSNDLYQGDVEFKKR